jgi:hypothetical protein
VLAHALFPASDDDEAARWDITTAIAQIGHATDTLAEFPMASVFGYFRVCSAVLHERPAAEG